MVLLQKHAHLHDHLVHVSQENVHTACTFESEKSLTCRCRCPGRLSLSGSRCTLGAQPALRAQSAARHVYN
jgi:hypothetical protein